MKHFDQIIHAYNETDTFLRDLAGDASAQTTGALPLVDAQGINERAYFVLLVAQFEDLVNVRAGQLIDRHRRSAEWPHRKLWDNLVANNRRIQDIPLQGPPRAVDRGHGWGCVSECLHTI